MRIFPLSFRKQNRLLPFLACLGLGPVLEPVLLPAQTRDTLPDTWVGADALGRTMPGIAEAGPLKSGKTVAMFYFLWLGPHENGGPYDTTKILRQDPGAMQKPDSPLWGPMHVPHHWGEPHLGYYRSDDEFVLAKHAQMLADAGVDTLVFDVTNQLTYAHEYRALLETFSRVRKNGGRTPQVAFLCPFWTPKKVVRELWRDLYSKGDHEDLWFKLDGKPFILANPGLIGETIGQERHNGVSEIAPGAVEGQTFTLTQPAAAVSASFATWGTSDAGLTLTLRKAGPAAAGTDAPVATRSFTNVQDNSWLELRPDKPLEPGEWILEASQPSGKVGWWRHTKAKYEGGAATLNGAPVDGDRMFRVEIEDEEARQIRAFFTFRSPQADYFRGAERPDMWSWLEVAPQHVFANAKGEAEMMSVGVAQNAVAGKLGCLSTVGALGRTWHDGARDTRPDAVRLGLNFTEQWRNARQADPPTVFVTGWNEWIAGRYNEFNGVREPVMFVDQFSQEFSRDIEPMRGGHGDDYYYQLVSEVRRFKGVRPLPAAGPEKTITNAAAGSDGKISFSQWSEVTPVFLEDAGDIAPRDHIGYGGKLHYENRTGRNDITECRVARDPDTIWFYAKTREPLTPSTDANWMRLLLDTDANPATGWHGYDFRFASGALEQWTGEKWEPAAVSGTTTQVQTSGSELQISIPRNALKLPSGKTMRIDFKWMDNIPSEASPLDWIDSGDTAPNGRLNYRFQSE